MASLVSRPVDALSGSLRVPGDKSISHRSVIFAALAEGQTRVRGFLRGEDSLHTLAAFAAMGVDSRWLDDDELLIDGVGLRGLRQPSGPLYLGNSGTAMRLLTGLLSAQAFATRLEGDASLQSRPMRRVTEPLAGMGAEIELSESGTPPVRIAPAAAGLRPIDYAMPVASAQVKSALLLAALYAEGETCVHEPAVTRDHTENMLRTFGYAVDSAGGSVRVRGNGTLTASDLAVPGDISSAAFFLVAASIVPGSDLLLRDVGINPTRTGVLDVLWQMGADITVLNPRDWGAEPVADLRVKSAPLSGVAIDPELVPRAIDEFPVLFVAAACAEGETLLEGASELRVKESDRIGAMADGLQALGVAAEPLADGMRVRGGRMHGGRVASRGDHRIAMAMAVAGLRARAPVTVDDTDNVATSYPNFAAQANAIGARIEDAS